MSDAGLDRADTFAALKSVLEDASIAKVGHDLKFATVALARHGITLAGLDLDTMLAAYLLDASRSSQDLEPLALEQLGYRARLADDVRGKGAKAVSFTSLAPDRVLDFAGERADLAWQLAERLAPELEAAGVAPVYRDLELPLVPILAGLERVGVKVDTPGAGRPGRAHGTGDGRAGRRDLQAGRRDLQHRLARSSSARSCSTSCSCRC